MRLSAAVGLVVVAGLVLGGVYLVRLSLLDGIGGASAQTAAPPPPPKVTVARALKERVVEWDEFTGRFEAVEHVELRARVSGYLAEVHVADGQVVKKGDLLFTIDQRPYINALERAKGAVAAAAAALEQAQNMEARTARLRETNSAAFQRASYEDQMQQRLQTQGQLDQARAELATAMLDLEFTEIRAPVDGRSSYRRVDVGNLVSTDTLLTTLVSLDPIYFVFDLNESDYLAFQRAVLKGELTSTRDQATAVSLNLVDEKDWHRTGQMNFVDNVVDESTGTVRARAVFPNADLIVTPGQFGRIRIPGSPEYEAILIPDEAIVTDQSRKLVMVVGEDGTVGARPIRPGPREDGLRIVRSGLDGGERIVINGVVRARPGAKVTPEEGRIERRSDVAAAAR